MNKIVLQGMRDIKTEEKDFDANCDYGIFLVASLKGKYIPETFEEDKGTDVKFFFEISHLDNIVNLKDNKEVKVKSGQTKSQKWRWLVENELGEYDAFMDWQFKNKDKIFDSYKDSLIKYDKTRS